MEVLVDRKELYSVVNEVRRAASAYKAQPRPVPIHLQGEDEDTLRVELTLPDCILTQTIPARVAAPGAVAAADLDGLCKLVWSLSRYTYITLETAHRQLHVRAEQTEAWLDTIDPGDLLAPWDDGATDGVISIDPIAWRDALERVIPHAGTDPTRSDVLGVYIEPVDGGTRLVGTEGHALCWIELPERLEAARRIGADAAGVLVRFLARAEEADLGLVKDAIVALRPGGRLVLRQVADGDYVDYRSVLPDYEAAITLSSNALYSAACRCRNFASAPARTRVEQEGDRLVLTVQRGDEELVEEVLIDEVQRGWTTTHVNAELLARCLGSTRSDVITIRQGNALDPILWDVDAEGYGRVVFMPMRSLPSDYSAGA